MARIRKTKYVILGLLTHGNLSGYDIKKIVENQLSHFWSESFGQIYPAIQELEGQGFIEPAEKKPDIREDKKLYKITNPGREELVAYLKRPVEEEKIRYEILLKLFFGGSLSDQEIIKQIMEFKARQEERLKEVAAYERELKSLLNISRDHVFYYLTALCGKNVYQAYIDWCNEALSILNDVEKR